MGDIRVVVRRFIVENFASEEEEQYIYDNTQLQAAGILDSLCTLKLMSFLQQQFDIDVELQDLDSGRLVSIETIERLVESKTAAKV